MPHPFQPGDTVLCVEGGCGTTGPIIGTQYVVSRIESDSDELLCDDTHSHFIHSDGFEGGWFASRFTLVTRGDPNYRPPLPKTNHKVGVPKGHLP